MGFRHVIGFLQYLALKIKGLIMFYKITDKQLRAIKQALDLCEDLIEVYTQESDYHKHDVAILDKGFLAFDTVIDNQEVKND
jgi:hypothetical protein